MINLLPPKEKREILEEEHFKLFLILGTLFLLFLVLLSLVLFSTKIYIAGGAQNQITSIHFQFQDLEKEIQTVNQELLDLDSFYENQPDYASLIEKISQILPKGVYLTHFSLALPTISLQGYSPSRELLLGLKKNLESELSFKDVYFPPSNWVKPIEIEFNANFQFEK